MNRNVTKSFFFLLFSLIPFRLRSRLGARPIVSQPRGGVVLRLLPALLPLPIALSLSRVSPPGGNH